MKAFCVLLPLLFVLLVNATQVDLQRRWNKLAQKFKALREATHRDIRGQDYSIDTILNDIEAKELGLSRSGRPLVYLLVGPTGVGKTETVESLSRSLKMPVIRLMMTDFTTHYDVMKIIGSPHGYVGSEKGGLLTNGLQENPASIVLIDEVEKAHSQVLTAFLTAFDEGHVTDNQGKKHDCSQAIFFMTSNLAQREVSALAPLLRRAATHEERMLIEDRQIKTLITPRLLDYFKRKEVLGRVSNILLYLPLQPQHAAMIAEMTLERAKERLKNTVNLQWTQGVVDFFAAEVSSVSGARGIRNFVDEEIQDLVSRAFDMGKIHSKDSVLKVRVARDEEELEAVVI